MNIIEFLDDSVHGMKEAALGSDPMRELLSSIRLMRGDVHPTLFVEKGDQP